MELLSCCELGFVGRGSISCTRTHPPTRARTHTHTHRARLTLVRAAQDTILTSIIAGVPIEAFHEYTNIKHIVRAMPNTPVTVEQGCTVW